ncbi:helix-turn-helix transcriptional regulator [Rhodococcus corynebacterioides]|uniref:Helix-turn-helix transcriptional regulator n=2 Tax=Rhodococcoides corynebacterioides TaxID=53972 RepID=A0ABS7P8R1_9NOCA|nr:helix-turn-helix transcriptional regulator [Rhodococcus corynebacterioides]MBY6409840.1 helix-turn-helix transcriptional regulator [Rhodococcus corynebacterioides]
MTTAIRHHRDGAVSMVCGVHSGDGGSSASHDVLARSADVEVALSRASVQDVADMAAERGITLSHRAAQHLTRHASGRPGVVAALLDELPPDAWRINRPVLPAPAADRRRVRDAVSDGGASVRALVTAAAVLGDRTPLPTVCAVAALDDPWSALDAAERADLLAVNRSATAVTVDTTDAVVRAAILAMLGEDERARLHRVAATTVEDRADALAHLVESRAVPDPAVSDRLDEVAAERATRGEWATAARLYALSSRASTDAAERDARLVRAVDAAIGAGDVPTAAGWSAEIESFRDTPAKNAVLGYLAILRGRPQDAEARLHRAWTSVRQKHDPRTAATICHREVLHNLARCRGADLVTWADRAVDLVGATDATAVEARTIRGLGLGSTGRTAEALASYDDLLAHVESGAMGQRVQMGAGWLHLATDRPDAARAELESALPTDFLGGSTRISLWAHGWLARCHVATGDWNAALRVAAAGLDLADRSGSDLIVPLLRWTVTQVHALRGDWDAADESARAGDAGVRDYEIMRVPALLARAAVAEARADYAAVLRILAPLTEDWARGDISEPGFWPWPDVFANALVVEGRLDEADAFLRAHEERVRLRGHRSAGARLAYARGRLLGARGDLDAARDSFESAVTALADLPLVYDRARVQFAYGQTLRRAGKRREADVVISAARDAYLALGANTYVARCERELKAGGMRAVLKDRPHDALTPQEDAVASLVATGMSNREVAAELFLSVKTVQFHLTRVYAKLGIRSRAELAARSAGSE